MKSKQTHPRLTLKAQKIIAALLENSTQEKAAAASGISTVTIWRYLQKPAFQKALQEARQAAFSQIEARMQQGAAAAAGTLFRIMTDGNAPEASRFRAAQYVIDFSARSLRQQALEARVLELERLLATASLRESAELIRPENGEY